MQKLEIQNGRIIGWYCSCMSYNDILELLCWDCQEVLRDESLAVVANITALERLGLFEDAKRIDWTQ